MEERFKKSIIFGVATFGLLVIASIFHLLAGHLLQFSPIFLIIIGILVGIALKERTKALKACVFIGFIGSLMVSLSFIIFGFGVGEISIAVAIVCMISAVGGSFLGHYFSPLFYSTSQQRSNRYLNQPNEERDDMGQSTFDRTMNDVQNEARINTKNEGRQNQFENTPSSSTETEPSQPAGEAKSNVCPNCGREVEDDWNVCIDCGTSLK